jgi:outer membrane protein assembly factor BamE (lipoprotein component of BamABCDE complex)
MRTWCKILSISLALMLVQACVSTGTQEITDPGRTGGLAAGKSTQAEVSAVLGFPAIVTYDKQRQETWDYYYVTEYPQVVAFVPVVNGLADGLKQNTKVLAISFDRQGVIRNLHKSQATGNIEVYPY